MANRSASFSLPQGRLRALVTGPDGQIGAEIIAAIPDGINLVTLGIDQMDYTDPASIRRCLGEIRPNLIINAAGYTAVDRAEAEPDLAMAVNARAVGIIGEEARRLGCAVVHFSTDYVFDGNKSTPYTPEDSPNPQSVYAQSKLEGERALAASGASHLTIRTAWIYGMRGRNFLLAVLRQAAEKPELRIVSDQIGCPTWSRSVARATVDIIVGSITSNASSKSFDFGGREGLYHLCCGGSTSWYEFARRILELADVQSTPKLVPITTEEYGARAKRPKYSVLDCSKTFETFGVPIANWSVALEELLSEHRVAPPVPAAATRSAGGPAG